MKPRVLLRLPQHSPEPPQSETKLERAARIYAKPFGTDGKTTKGITFWHAERVAELAQANQAHRAARKPQEAKK